VRIQKDNGVRRSCLPWFLTPFPLREGGRGVRFRYAALTATWSMNTVLSPLSFVPWNVTM
jgi:hypothetical protein